MGTQIDDDLRDQRKAKFLETYAKTAVIQPGLDAAGIGRSTYKRWRKEDEDFHDACNDAYDAAVDGAEVEMRKRGVEGYEELILVKGQPIWRKHPDTGELLLDDDFNPIPFTKPVKSDRLIEVYVRSHRPIYKERTEVAITGPGGGPVDTKTTIEFVMPDGKTAKDYPEGATPKMDHKTGKPVEAEEADPLDD